MRFGRTLPLFLLEKVHVAELILTVPGRAHFALALPQNFKPPLLLDLALFLLQCCLFSLVFLFIPLNLREIFRIPHVPRLLGQNVEAAMASTALPHALLQPATQAGEIRPVG